VRRGVDPTRIFASIYQRNASTEPHAMGALLGRTEYFGEGRLAVVDQPLRGDASLLENSDPVLDVLRAVDSVEVVLSVREIQPGLCKLSARSKTTYDVNMLARQFGGGGHVKASGATITGSLSDVRQRLIEAALRGFDAQ
jgi:phosphoesterase RecJ-like protein